MTLDELRQKLPPDALPWVDEYGPVFLAMAAEEIKAWIDLVFAGDIFGAAKTLFDKLGGGQKLDAWRELGRNWADLNVRNADRIAAQKAATEAIVRICVTIGLAAITL